jgi:signal transduction histidine kinase
MDLIKNPITIPAQIEFLKKHSKTGALAHLFLPLTLYFITDFSNSHLFYFVGFFLLTALFALTRFGLCADWWKNTRKTDLEWLKYFDTVTLLQGLLIGTTGPILLASYTLTSFQMQFYFLSTAIFAIGSMMSFAVRPNTSIVFITAMLVPISVAVFFIDRTAGNFFISIGTWIFLIFSISQIMQLHQNQVALNKREEAINLRDNRLHEFINSIPGPVFWLDSELKYQDMNESFLQQHNISRESLLGEKMNSDNTPERIIAQLNLFIGSPEQMFTTEIEYNTNSQTKNYLSVFTKHNFAQSLNISVMSLDITELKTKEREIEAQKLQLIENEKMISLGELAGSIAHEVNNPLAIISGKAHVMIHKIDHGETDFGTLRAYTSHIYETAFRIKKIISSLRILANDGRVGSIEPHTVVEVIQPVLDITQSKIINQQIELKLEHEDPGAKVACGLIEMGQVLMNLIVNSIHALETIEENKWIKIKTSVKDGKVRIQFIDCGLGIPEDIQRKIFTPFFTTKGLEKGTGIGLSHSRKLIQKQGGDFYYDSNAKNTTFIIELPIVEKSFQQAS